MDVECPACGTKGARSSADAGGEPGSGQVPWAGGEHPRAPLAGAEPHQSCSFAVGLLPPGKSMFVLACSARAGLGPCQGGWHQLGIPADWTQRF